MDSLSTELRMAKLEGVIRRKERGGTGSAFGCMRRSFIPVDAQETIER